MAVRAIICGGREYQMDAVDWWRLDAFHAADPEPLGRHGCPLGPLEAVYEGEAEGADRCARAWADSREVPWAGFVAEWERLGRAAGPARNVAMLEGRFLPDQRWSNGYAGRPALANASHLPPADMVIKFPGGAGTQNMSEEAESREVPVLNLGRPRAQRWTAEHIADLRSFANSLALDKSGTVDEQRRAAVRATARAHGGLGIPCASAHLFRTGGTDHLTLPPGALYVGRPGTAGARKMQLPDDGDGSILCNPVPVKPDMTEAEGAAAMAAYRDHLRMLYRSSEPARMLLDRIALGGTLLVCWCHASKPCHTTVIAEAALLVRARREIQAKGLPLPPAASARSRATPPASAVGRYVGAAS